MIKRILFPNDNGGVSIIIPTESVEAAMKDIPSGFNRFGTQIGTFCRAWVNFNGTGTVAIRASFNVSSITDNGTGDYTVNFTTAMADANYAFVSIPGSGSTTTAGGISMNIVSLNTSSAQMRTYLGTTLTDYANIQTAIFR